MTIIFKVKTNDGYSMKILSELLQHNLKSLYFRINSKGVFLSMSDLKRRILIDIALKANKFNFYKFKHKEENLFIGINPSQLHKAMKSIKKKDSLVWKIDDSEPNLVIRVIPKENPTRISQSIVKIQEAQNIESDLPEGYGSSINLPSPDFQKACKEVASSSNLINVTSKAFQIKFICDGSSLIHKSVSFGEAEDSDADSDSDEEEPYNQHFEVEQLMRITKISGLGTDMQIFAKTGQPLLFKTSIGHIGRLSLFLRSKEQLEKDKEDSEDDN